jgi:DNA helicase-2/ATP-dependent DNA helicase PcrA
VRLIPGVGRVTAGKLLDALDEAADSSSVTATFKMPSQAAADWETFMSVFGALRTEKAKWPAELEFVIRWYEPHLERLYDDASARRADLAQLQQIASTYAARERFLTEMTLDPPEGTSGRADGAPGDDDYLILSTIHSAKGQEWKVVHILSAVDGCIPASRAAGYSREIEEERRLLYVAMTRAKDDLHVIVPQRFFVRQQAARGDRHNYAARTPFLTDEMLSLFDCYVWPVADQQSANPNAREVYLVVPIDLSARPSSAF